MLKKTWLDLGDHPLLEVVHRQWVVDLRMPIVDALTRELGLAGVAVMMNHRRADFEEMIRADIAEVVGRN